MEALSSGVALFTTAKGAIEAIITAKSTMPVVERDLKLADVVRSLMAMQIELQQAVLAKSELAGEVQRLHRELALKGNMEKRGDAYFLKGEDGILEPDELCVPCWEQDAVRSHLTFVPKESLHHICPKCKHVVSYRHIQYPERAGAV